MDDPDFKLSPDPDSTTHEILLAATTHNLSALKPYLRVPGAASVQDPETGITPLHAAIEACGPALPASHPSHGENIENGETGEEEEVDMEKAKEVVKELFMSGAIWNDLNREGETPGCVAWRLGRKEIYDIVVEAGVRAEMLLNLMGGYEPLADEDSEDEDGIENDTEIAGEVIQNGNQELKNRREEMIETEEKKDVNSIDYLQSSLTFTPSALLDSESNGVMMAWETSIMKETVSQLIPASSPPQRILNIGLGMGIIDHLFSATSPKSHHIIEAHPTVLQKLSSKESEFGEKWAKSAPEGGAYKIHAGKWQDILPQLLEEGEVFDVIYFDTFGEDYSELKRFFTEYVVQLLDEQGSFGWFNGLGADRRVCYDVYCKVAELDLLDAGLDVEWVDVEVGNLGEEGEGEWKGVKRRYWTLDRYRLPVCRFLG
ncbi:hypothetical protein B7494_g3990 [Chlorociboria aeruginascens]|nr:hypothetical protein B7494_g3990 [Chlorociboria aeruginascens]